MAAKPANAAQRKWMKDIAEWTNENGLSAIYGKDYSDGSFQLHHALGRSAKHNKVAIGHEFIIPVWVSLHDVDSNHPLNVTHHKKAFVNEFGNQRDIFQAMASAMSNDGYEVPSAEICNAIMDTRA